MESVVAVAAPFAMVVAMGWVVQQGKVRRAELSRSSSREEEAVMGAMQAQIDKLTDRVAVLERLVTDDDLRLAREIDSLRGRDRPPA